MKLKKVLIFIVILFCVITIIPISSNATTAGVITNMKGVNQGGLDPASGLGKVINVAIKTIQVAGTAISLIMVTVLGIRYMLASSNEKADIKKQLVPMITGCVLLFAAVNIVAIIAEVGNGLN